MLFRITFRNNNTVKVEAPSPLQAMLKAGIKNLIEVHHISIVVRHVVKPSVSKENYIDLQRMEDDGCPHHQD